MAASPDGPALSDISLCAPQRRRRFERAATSAALTPPKLKALTFLLDYRFLLVPQLARLMGCSEQSARRNLRELYDGGYVEKIAVPRAALVDDGEENDPSLTYGSAPPIHTLSKLGVKALIDAGIVGGDTPKQAVGNYGPRNALFLRHEVFVRDIRIWLATLTAHGVGLRSWRDAPDCVIKLPDTPVLKPDGAFILDLGHQKGKAAVLAGFVEADRGTERGPARWNEKVRGYASLFADPDQVNRATGFRHARVVILARTEARRDWIWETIEEVAGSIGAGPEIAERFWIADKVVLTDGELIQKQWRIPTAEGLSRLTRVSGNG